MRAFSSYIFFFFTDTATTEIYTLSLHDALPISIVYAALRSIETNGQYTLIADVVREAQARVRERRSEEHTSELQSRGHLVCRLLLEKKKKKRAARNYCVMKADVADVSADRCVAE